MDPNLAAYAAQNREEQQEEGGLLDALGKIALGAGALAAGAIGARRLAQGLKTGATVDLSSFSPKNVRRVAAEYLVPKEVVPPSRPAPTTAIQRQQEAIEFTRQARAERPTGVRQANLTELAAAQRLAEDPELLRLVKQQEAENLSEARSYQAKAQAEYRNLLSAKADEALASIRNEGTTGAAAAQQDFAAQYLKTAGYTDAVTMVDQQAGNLIAQIDHFANASNSAEDQVTGRVKAALARNEDVNLGAVEIAEDQVDAQIARAVQGDPTVASVTEVDAAINQVADGLPDGRPIDQAELDLAKITEYQQSRTAQIANTLARGKSLARAERNVQMTPSQQAAMERILPSYSPEDIMSRPGLQTIESEGVPPILRNEPAIVSLGTMVSPASKTSYRGITGRPDYGIYGEVPSGKRGYVEFGPGSVEVSKVIINEGEERGVTTPRRFEPGYNLAKQETPEGFVYTEEAMQRPTAGTSKTGLENVNDEAVGMMTMVGDPMQRESARAELARRDPEYLQQRVKSGEAGETVRRIMSSGRPDAQKLVNEYLAKLRQ